MKLSEIDEIKIKNIIDMAYGFTAMQRNFEANSSPRIKAKLFEAAIQLNRIKGEDEFKSKHREFCYWMMKNVKTAVGRKNEWPSFGQSAKILDITLKVVAYYCHLCKDEILFYLNSAIDTPILKQIKQKSALSQLRGIQSISQIDEEIYHLLQEQIRLEIDEVYGGKILTVQYDDIVWRSLNR
jgi:hypothetical protein